MICRRCRWARSAWAATCIGAPNLALADINVPQTVERGISFPVRIDVSSSGPPGFLAGAGAVPLRLLRLPPGADATDAAEANADAPVEGSKMVGAATLDLQHGRAHASFQITESSVGLVHYQVVLGGLPGEISQLDNVRRIAVEVRERSLHVLYVSRSLGLSYKPLRSELARDGGIGFTALFRTLGGRLARDTGERFTIQGERLAGDERLGAGLPEDPSLLTSYDCIILGAFPAQAWSVPAQQALVSWVEAGGALVLEGGEEAFGRGGYASSPLAPLMPWQISAEEPALARASFALSIPPQAQGQAVVQGLQVLLAGGPAIASLNQPGPLRGGAQALLECAGPSGTTRGGGGAALWQGQGHGHRQRHPLAPGCRHRLGGGSIGLRCVLAPGPALAR